MGQRTVGQTRALVPEGRSQGCRGQCVLISRCVMSVPVPGSPSPPPLLCPAGIRGAGPPWGVLAELSVGLLRLRMATPPASGALGVPSGLGIVQTGEGLGRGREHGPNRPDPSRRACTLALPGHPPSSLGLSESCVLWRLSDCPKEKGHVKRGWGSGWGMLGFEGRTPSFHCGFHPLR